MMNAPTKKGKASKETHPVPENLTITPVKGFEDVARVLALAYHQTTEGKGAERHSSGYRAFADQPISQIPRSKGLLIGLGGLSFQIEKKSGEADRMVERATDVDAWATIDVRGQYAAAMREMLGVIVYSVAKYLYIEEQVAMIGEPLRPRRNERDDEQDG